MRARVGWWLRRLADRVDYRHAPKGTHWTFTFELHEGIRFREDGRGCRLWYLDDDEYERAHTESDSAKAEAQRNIDLYGLCGCGWPRRTVMTPTPDGPAHARLDLLCSNTACWSSVPGP